MSAYIPLTSHLELPRARAYHLVNPDHQPNVRIDKIQSLASRECIDPVHEGGEGGLWHSRIREGGMRKASSHIKSVNDIN